MSERRPGATSQALSGQVLELVGGRRYTSR